ncbi:hypothetical protein BGW38_008500, partial [Lunasporangiospora selenospora]
MSQAHLALELSQGIGAVVAVVVVADTEAGSGIVDAGVVPEEELVAAGLEEGDASKEDEDTPPVAVRFDLSTTCFAPVTRFDGSPDAPGSTSCLSPGCKSGEGVVEDAAGMTP